VVADDPAPHRNDVPGWPLWTLPAAFALGLGLTILLQGLVAVAAKAGGSSISHPSTAVNLALDVTTDGGFVVAVLYFTVWQSRSRASDFGFRRVNPALALASLVTAGVGYFVLSLLYSLIFTPHGQDKLPNGLGSHSTTAALAAGTAFVCVVAPIAEEFIFRGYIFGLLRRLPLRAAGRDLSTWVAAAITGVLFGLAHVGSASSQYLAPLALLGFVLCLLRWRTGSLYPGMVMHSVNNALALGISLHWPALAVLGAAAASLACIAALTGRLAGPAYDPAGSP
jgi:membrane protease YdiL (CAAX protease family)